MGFLCAAVSRLVEGEPQSRLTARSEPELVGSDKDTRRECYTSSLTGNVLSGIVFFVYSPIFL
jgi:hypothetical protein